VTRTAKLLIWEFPGGFQNKEHFRF